MGTWTGPRSVIGRLDEQLGHVIALAAEHGSDSDLVARKRRAILERVRRIKAADVKRTQQERT